MFEQLEGALNSEYVPSFAQPSKKKLTFKKDPEQNSPSPRLSIVSKNQFMSQKGNTHQRGLVLNQKDITISPKKFTQKTNEWDIPLSQLENYSFTKATTQSPKEVSGTQTYVGRGMRPPLSQKGSQKGSDKGGQIDTRQVRQLFFNKPKVPVPDTGKFQFTSQTAKPQNFNSPQSNRLYQDQITGLKRLMDQQKQQYEIRLQSREKEYQEEKRSLTSLHQQQLKNKLQLKDLEITKLKELHQFEIKSKSKYESTNINLAQLISKFQEKADKLQRINTSLTSQNGEDPNISSKLSRELSEAQKRNKQLKQSQLEFGSYQKETRSQLFQQKKALLNEYKRLQDLQDAIVDKEKKTEIQSRSQRSKMEASQEETKRQYQQKLSHLQVQQDSLKHEKKMANELQSTYQGKHKQLLEQTHQRLRELNHQKIKVQQKTLEYSRLLKELDIKTGEVDHLREQLKNKIQLLDLQRKKFKIESVPIMSSTNPDRFNRTGSSMFPEAREESQSQVTRFPESEFKKSLTDLKNQYLRSLQNVKLA